MFSFYCQDRLYQKFGGISQKSAKNTEQWFLFMHIQIVFDLFIQKQGSNYSRG